MKDVFFRADDELDKVLANLTNKIYKSSAVVDHMTLPEIKGQPIHFSRVLENLINNAIKYQLEKKGHVPTISISFMEKPEEWIFLVKDNGIGIEESYFVKIFEPFQRLNARAAYEGTGIGLTMCKRIVEEWGGTLSISSSLGEGSTFSFTVKK